MERIPVTTINQDRVSPMNDGSSSTLSSSPPPSDYTSSLEGAEFEFVDDFVDEFVDEPAAEGDSNDFIHIAAGAVTSAVFLILLVVWLIWFRRRRKRKFAAKLQPAEELELRRTGNSNSATGNSSGNVIFGTGNTGSSSRQYHNHNNYASASPPPTQLPVPVPLQSPRATGPSITTPNTAPIYPSPALTRPLSTIVVPGSNAAYFTGTGIGIDTSDRVSVADAPMFYNTSRPVDNTGPTSEYIVHHEEEPPPPYQAREVPNG